MGACEIYPQTIQHNPNGRFVVVCGDGEYIIYTSMALRNKSYGAAVEFAWAADANMYAVRESGSTVKMFKNFKETRILKPDYTMDGLYGGSMLGVRCSNSLCFYDWENMKMIRRIELVPTKVSWNESGELVSLATQEAFFILKFNSEAVSQAQEGDLGKISEDGIEDAFEPIGEVQESVKTACWIGDCFVYTTALNRLNYYVGGEIVTIAHLDRPMYLLGYIPKESRLYLADKDLNVISYQLLLPVLEYQTAVMRRDFETADKVLPTVPRDQRTRVAHFLEKQGFKKQALAVSQDPEHRFDLALQLGELKIAYELAAESDSEEKWRQLSQEATARSELLLAGDCLGKARDYGGLLLLASSAGSAQLMGKLAVESKDSGQNNVAFVSNFMLGKVDDCLEILIKTNRLPEAAFFARTYCPSQISRVVTLWKERVAQTHPKVAEGLADPMQYENLFPGLKEASKAEQYLKHLCQRPIPATAYVNVPPNYERNVAEEVAEAEASGALRFNVDGELVVSGSPKPHQPVVIDTKPYHTKSVTPPSSLETNRHWPPEPMEVPVAAVRGPPIPLEQPGAAAAGPEEEDEDPYEEAVPEHHPQHPPGPDIARIPHQRPDLVPMARGPDIAADTARGDRGPAPEVVQDSQGGGDSDDDEEVDVEDDLDLDNLDIQDDEDDDFNLNDDDD